ncbi:MAG TPA: hypothetical protein HA261_11740, partial [Methanosarcina sp.]|nr:hypothetical protein [Methanosarcina sp.]
SCVCDSCDCESIAACKQANCGCESCDCTSTPDCGQLSCEKIAGCGQGKCDSCDCESIATCKQANCGCESCGCESIIDCGQESSDDIEETLAADGCGKVAVTLEEESEGCDKSKETSKTAECSKAVETGC